MKLGVLGGTFDPIHIGHLLIAERAREDFGLQKVLFIPAGLPVHREAPFASSADRYQMVLLATEDNSDFLVSDLEIVRPGFSYTYDTVQAIRKNYGSRIEIFLIVGADAFREVGDWYRITELVSEVTFLVAERDEASNEPVKLPAGIRFCHFSTGFFPVSARQIRGRLKEGRSVRYLVPESVWQYIRERRLYL